LGLSPGLFFFFCSQSNPHAINKNTNTISVPNNLTNSELNTANVKEKNLAYMKKIMLV